MSLISVIIPNFNHAFFLEKRINSILNQTYQDFEVIILDDCSTDNSRDIIQSYKSEKKVTNVVFNEKNSGSTFKQWQKGISLAKGKYIWIAESDDYADISFLEKVIDKFNSELEIGIVYCDSNIIRNEITESDFYKKYRNNTFKTDRWNFDYSITGKDEINNYLIYDCTINNTSAMVFKKSLVNEHLFKNLSVFKYSGDWYFFLYISQNCNIAYISEALNYFRQGTNNFAKGIKSPLNHFKERSLVRYLILEHFPKNLNSQEKVFKQMGTEFKHKIFELIKHPGNFKEFISTCNFLFKANKSFFFKQLKYSFSR